MPTPLAQRRSVRRRREIVRSPALMAVALVLAAGGWVVRAQSDVPEAPALPGMLVYTRQSDADVFWDLFVSRGDGQDETQVSDTEDDNSRGEDQPRWSPDGREIAFTTFNRNGDAAKVWRMPYTGGEPALVAEIAAADAGYPAWRPDGGAILYAGAHSGAGPSSLDLYLALPEASQPFLVTETRDERSPDWSPDGSRIAYAAYDLGPDGETNWWDLRMVAADGSGDAPLVTRAYSTERFPRWSPDGRQLAYVAFANSVGFGRGVLHLLDVETGEDRELLRNIGLPVAWSPDGEWLLLYNTVISGLELPGRPTAEPPAPSEPQRFGLYVYRLADGALYRLKGAAGGGAARSGSFKWGQVADWTAGTYTPTPEVTETPTPSPSPTASRTPTASPSPSASPSREVSPTPLPQPAIYLPMALDRAAMAPLR